MCVWCVCGGGACCLDRQSARSSSRRTVRSIFLRTSGCAERHRSRVPHRLERTRTSSLVKGNLHGSMGSRPTRDDSTLLLVKGTFRGLGLLLGSPVSTIDFTKNNEVDLLQAFRPSLSLRSTPASEDTTLC